MARLSNERHERFCIEYIRTLNAKQSYLIAYPESSEESAKTSGARLLSNANVGRRIEELMAQDRKKRIASAEEVLELLTEIARGETTEQIVTPKGKIVEAESNTQARLKALDLLAKRYNLTTNSKIDLDANVQVVFEGEGDLLE